MTRKFFVYTKPNCPHCNRAKNLLRDKGMKFTAQSLENEEERQQLLASLNGWATFPVILELDPETGKPVRFVGGADALEQMLAGG